MELYQQLLSDLYMELEWYFHSARGSCSEFKLVITPDIPNDINEFDSYYFAQKSKSVVEYYWNAIKQQILVYYSSELEGILDKDFQCRIRVKMSELFGLRSEYKYWKQELWKCNAYQYEWNRYYNI